MIHRLYVLSPTFAAALCLVATATAANDNFPVVTTGEHANLSAASRAPWIGRHDSTRHAAPVKNVLGTAAAVVSRAQATGSDSRELEVPAAAGVPDGSGGHIVVWEDARNAAAGSSYAPRDLRLQRLDANGDPQWGSAGVAVCTAPDTWNDRTPSLVADVAGGVYVAWEDNRLGYNHDIYAQHVSSAGVPQWLADGIPVCSASGSQFSPVVVPDGTGGAILSWDDGRSETTIDIYAQRLTSSGQMLWATDGVLIQQNVNSRQSMIADGSGGAIVCWVDYRASNFDIYAQKCNSSGAAQWTANGVAACAASGDQSVPTPVSDNAGGVVIVWEDSRTGTSDVYAQRIGSAGSAMWTSDGVVVCTAASTQTYISAAPDGVGGALIAWADYRGGSWTDIYAQRLNSAGGAVWTSGGVSVCAAQNSQFSPSIVADGSGGAFLAWSDQRNGYFYDICAQHLNSMGTAQWSADGVFVCWASGSQFYPSVQADGAGGMIVSWDDPRSGLDTDRYAQRLNSSGTSVWASNGVPAFVTPGVQRGAVSIPGNAGETLVAWSEKNGAYYDLRACLLESTGQRRWTVVVASTPTVGSHLWPVLATDGSGGAIVAWEIETSNAQYSNIYAQRVTHDGVCAWAANGVAVCSANYDQTLPCIVSDGSAGAVIAWQDRRVWTNTDIYAQRVNAAGLPQWTANGVAVCVAADYQQAPVMVSDGSSGAIMTWVEWRNLASSSVDIYAQRINASGVPQWTANGVAVCAAPESQGAPAIVADGAGGAIMTWEDFRTGTIRYYDIYAQRVSATGVPQWAANGVAVSDAWDTQMHPALVSDGAGGAIIAWEHYDCYCVGPYDIYAQRMSGSGAPQWTINGVQVCAAADDQLAPRLVSDGVGGAIITWEDFRTGAIGWLDIYAQRVSAAGVPQWTPDGAAVSMASLNQCDPSIVPDGAGGAILVWEDSRGGNGFYLYSQRLNADGAAQWSADGVTPTLLSLASVVTSPASVRLAWYAANGPGLTALVYRRRAGTDWEALGAVAGDGTGLLRYEDRSVIPGERYGYRLGVNEGGTERFYGETWVDVPVSFAFALDPLRPNPTRGGALTVHFTLPSAAAASLELVDVAGRRIAAREVGSLGAGPHALDLGEDQHLAPGLYLVCLRQGTSTRVARVAVLK